MDLGQFIFVLLMAFSLSACAGIRAFIPPLAISILAATGHLTLAPQFTWMGNWEVVAIFAVATVLELIADKYPGVDNVLDGAGLLIKPVMGALLASSIITGIDPVLALCIGIIVGGGSAGLVHAGKAKLRLLSTGFTGGAGNPILSFLEDVLAIVWTSVGIWLPVLAAILVAIGLALLIRKLSSHFKAKPEEEVAV